MNGNIPTATIAIRVVTMKKKFDILIVNRPKIKKFNQIKKNNTN